MSVSFFKKAFGIKKPPEDTEFDDFFKFFDRSIGVPLNSSCRNLKRHLIRFLVVGADGKKVFFDSHSSKDSLKPLPTFSFGSKQVSFAELVFGSDFLNASKDLLYSIKVHDVSTCNQVLVTRFVSDLDSWRTQFSSGRRSFGCKRAASSVPQMSVRSDHIQNSVVACLLFNLEEFRECSASISSKPTVSLGSTSSRRTPLIIPTIENSNGSSITPRQRFATTVRFYKLLFEHCTSISVLVEALADTAFSAVSKTARGFFSASGTWSETQCSEAIGNAFSVFTDNFFDILTPRLHFPVWSTLNNALTVASESCSLIEQARKNVLTSWLNSIPGSCSISYEEDFPMGFDSLADLFVRGCIQPLLSRGGREQQCFMGQLLTGLLMLHPGWVNSLISPPLLNVDARPAYLQRSSASVALPNVILNQLLVQVGCMETNLECLAGSVFNCTVLYGSVSKKYLMALLLFATYFLRFSCMLLTNEIVPDLGTADLFELEQQKRQHSRVHGKTRRKSGSATGGDAHDSGISSQEDLTMAMFSASTGTSPAHTTSLALCMTNLLTRDQLRAAELAAQKAVSREAAVNAARLAAKSSAEFATSVDRIVPNQSTSVTNPYSRLLEIPLLIEKCVDDGDELCWCLPPESVPLDRSNFSSSSSAPSSVSSLSRSSLTDTPSAVTINVGKSSSHSPLGTSSPRGFAPSSVGRSQSRMQSSPSVHVEPDRRPLTRANSPVITNHNLIGNSVLDRYCSGLALQATTEKLESFKTRLLNHLKQWLKLGPLIIRGMNLSMKQTLPEHSSLQCYSTRQPRLPLWSTSAMVVNAETKTVEVITVRQPTSRYRTSSTADTPLAFPHSLPGASRQSFSHSFGQPDESGSAPFEPKEFLIDPVRSAGVKPSPLVLRMLDRLRAAIERTSCASLVLRDLENSLYLIYHKSRVVADLLLRCGPSMLSEPERTALAAGCTVADLPLLYAIVASYSLPAATVLNEHQMDWWFC